MKRVTKKIIITLLGLIILVLAIGLALAYYPVKSIVKNNSISTEEAENQRNNFKGTHHLFKTTDEETLFIRRWNPDSVDLSKKETAVLIFHGITAHSGAYDKWAKIIAAGGYATFGLDYRGHGLSGGNRADYSSKERWIADLYESIQYIKGLGYSKVFVLGHSLGVAAALYVTIDKPQEIDGLILLSGAYEGKKGVSEPPSLFKKIRILSSSILRPSKQVVEYYREGMTGTEDPLFNFAYTLRFLTMLDVKELHLPRNIDIPVLVAVGDKDELFDVDKVKDLYNDVPGNKKEFLVLKDAFHAKFPDNSWELLVQWLNQN